MPYNAGGPVTDYKTEIGVGWRPLLDELHLELVKINPNYQTVQVKEKFGDLRVYVEGENTSQMHDVIVGFERRSSGICEDCGSSEGRHTKSIWIRTLCPSCDPRK